MFRIENSRILVSGLDSQDESLLEMHSHPRVAEALAEAQAMDREKNEVLGINDLQIN